MRFFLSASVLLFGSALAADEERVTFRTLQEEGFEIAGSHHVDQTLVVLLERGESSYLCSLQLNEVNGAYSTGPWNNYRDCDLMSGGPDFSYNSKTGELEPTK